jgi:hypothetical protein
MKKIICLLSLFFIFTTATVAQNKLEIEFKTGEDDLRGIGTTEYGLDVNLIFVNKPALLFRGVNRTATWPKNSIRKIAIPLDTSIVIGDLLAMELTRQHSNSNNPTTKSPDNWDINKVTVTATFKKNGQTTKYELLQTLERNGMPYRMTYENSETPKRLDFNRNPILLSGTTNWIDRIPPPQKASIIATFGVGGDDLHGGNDNAKIVITFKNSTKKLVYNNVNDRAQWNNFTEHISMKELTSLPNLTVNDINTVELWHTGGGGMGADNWDLDKFSLTITINGQSKQLVDRTGTPIHRFTGDTRKKVFTVE